MKESFIKKVLPLKDRLYERDNFFAALKKVLGGKQGIESWHDNTWRRGLADGTTVVGPIAGYFAEGYLGQYLVVLPDQDLVAVRQMRSPQGDHEKVDSFRDFPKLVQELVGTKALAKSASDL